MSTTTKNISIDDTGLKVTGNNFDLDMDFESFIDLDFFLDKALTGRQLKEFDGNKRSFCLSEKRFNRAMSFFKKKD